MKVIYNSTFDERRAPEKMENLWQGSSLSSIEAFNPEVIKNVVESLVRSRFSAEYSKIMKKPKRSRINTALTSTSSESYENNTEEICSTSDNHSEVFHLISKGVSAHFFCK